MIFLLACRLPGPDDERLLSRLEFESLRLLQVEAREVEERHQALSSGQITRTDPSCG